MSKNQIYGPPGVETPDIVEEVRRLFCPEVTSDGFQQVWPSDQQSLQALCLVTERLEFVQYLFKIRQIMQQHKKHEKPIPVRYLGGGIVLKVREYIRGHDHEFDGVDYDIEALCFYLLLTCIEIVVGRGRYMDPFDWLADNRGDLLGREPSPVQYMQDAKEAYYDEYGARRGFVRAVTEEIPDNLRNRLARDYALVKLDDGQINQQSWDEWQGNTDQEKVTSLAKHLYGVVRSKFTHEGHRTFFPTIPVEFCAASGSKLVLVCLEVSGEPGLIELLQEMVKQLVRLKLLDGVNPPTADPRVAHEVGETR